MPDAALIQPPEGRVAILPGAEVSAGVVVSADGHVVAECLPPAGTPRHFGPFARDATGVLSQSKPRFAVQRRLRGAPAVLLKTAPGSTDHPLDVYGQWLVEILPRIALIEDHFDLRGVSFIVDALAEPMRTTQEDSLALFGIRPEQIIEVGDETVFVDALIYPAPLTNPPAAIAPRCVEVLEQLATRVRANPVGTRRLYVREAASTPSRREDADIVALVERQGFTVVEPETLSLYQQIGLFRRAAVVVGAPGSALIDTMFSTEDLTLIVLAPESWREDTYESLMSLKHGRFIVLPPREDGEIDRDALAGVLATVTGARRDD